MSHSKENMDVVDDWTTAMKGRGKKFKLTTKRPIAETEELSEYEKRIQRNIAEKMAVLQALNVNDMKNNLQVMKRKKIPKPKLEPKAELPCRPKSLRLQSCNPDGVPVERKSEKSTNPEQLLPPILKGKNGILKMSNVCRKCFPEENPKTQAELLKDVSKSMSSYFTSRQDPITLRNSMGSFIAWISSAKLSTTGVCRITHYKCTSISVHPSEEKLIICCGSQNGELGIADMSSGNDGEQLSLMPHSSKISRIAFCHQYPSKLFTSSHDGTVLCADFHDKIFKKVFVSTKNGHLPIQFDFMRPQVLYASHGNGFVSIIDTRIEGMGGIPTYPLEKQAIRSISAHPTLISCFLTAGHGPYVKLWDTRFIRKRHPEPLQTIDCPDSVYSASFSPITGNYIAITAMEHIRILDNTNENLKEVSQFENPSTCIPCWHPQRDDVLAIGNLSHESMSMVLQKIPLQSSRGALLYEFTGLLLSNTCHVFAFHPNLPVFIGGSRQGKIFVFQ